MLFGLEISGSLGPEAAAFYAKAKGWARQQRSNTTRALYHWAALSFGQYWAQKFGTALVRGRAGVGWAAAKRHRAEMFARTAHGSMTPDGDATSEGAQQALTYYKLTFMYVHTRLRTIPTLED